MLKNKMNTNHNEKLKLFVTGSSTSMFSEQFRTIRTNIYFSMIDKKYKTFMVTSATASSGKSTISANLAATFASEENKVLLIDADLRKPTVHKTFGMNNNVGLTTLLTNRQEKLENVVYRTSSSGLYILTSGVIPPNPTDLIASSRMEEIMDVLKNHFDTIILDTPPVLGIAESQVLASKVDGVLIVIPKGQVKTEEVLKAKQTLEMSKANILGAIMNRVEYKNDRNYYYDQNS